MLRYVAQRVGLMIGTLFGVMLVTFVLSRVLPGSPVEMMLGAKPTQEQIDAARIALGLDQPLYLQFFDYLADLLRGDFGTSLRTSQPVFDDLFERMTATVEITTPAVILVVLIGVPLGVLSAVRRNSLLDHSARGLSIAGVALPLFLIAMLLQMLFYGALGWFPLQGRMESNILLDYPFDRVTGFYMIDTLLAGQWPAFFSALHHAALPILSLTLASLAIVTRITRSTMSEALNEDFVRTAMAYGLPKRTIYFRYALKATLIPMLTVVGLTYGYMLGGSIVVEYIFDWPGLGGYVVGSILKSDFPAVMGVTIFLATAYLTINLLVDLLYFAVDPRLRAS
ncbi:MAG: ABC transporter permease [Rhodospirillales bacterium]